jgi:hypothetical protein
MVDDCEVVLQGLAGTLRPPPTTSWETIVERVFATHD